MTNTLGTGNTDLSGTGNPYGLKNDKISCLTYVLSRFSTNDQHFGHGKYGFVGNESQLYVCTGKYCESRWGAYTELDKRPTL